MVVLTKSQVNKFYLGFSITLYSPLKCVFEYFIQVKFHVHEQNTEKLLPPKSLENFRNCYIPLNNLFRLFENIIWLGL